MKKSGEAGAVKEDIRFESSGGEELFMDKIGVAKENHIHLAEIDEVREENQRLKNHLSQILKDYQTLQMHFNNIVGQEANESTTNTNAYTQNQEPEEPEFIALSLGRTSSIEPKIDEKGRSKSREDNLADKEGLSLGLNSIFEKSTESLSKTNSENSVELVREQSREKSPSDNTKKTKRSQDEDVSPQNHTKRARVSVRVRCDTPTMNDGCQWRKYGQKIAKGNPCPRAYYRCTVASSCPVRKQVQRCADDMSILTTTYEGTHNHSLPISATAMASTTSAAASMLLSGSSTSSSGLATSSSPFKTASTSSPLHGINYYLSNNSRPNPFYLPTSAISHSPAYPTITLDLTSNSSASNFNKISSNLFSTPRYNSSTNLNFSSLESNPIPFSWSSGTQSHYKNNLVGNSLNFSRSTPHESYYQSYMQKSNPNPNSQQQPLPQDNIAAATKAITSDPDFQLALVTALSSIIGNRGNGGGGCDKSDWK